MSPLTPMNASERDRLRKLQDRFLALRSARAWAAEYGEEEPLCGPGSPSTRELREYLYPEAQEWIERTLREYEVIV